MQTSARNQFSGVVAQATAGAVNDEIIIAINGGQQIVATVTHDSAARLGLKAGAKVVALVKATSVIVMVDADATKVSARNFVQGKVTNLTKGAVNADVTITGDNGMAVAAIITNASVDRLGLAVGKPAAAMFKASSVIVGVDN
ncbi:molybdate transport system regulatory protein [Cupriavidus metallidurans]|jgi:molybdopterin-binding protein|uniref:Molybdenum-pterin binding domain (Dual function transport/regulation) n=1 Tax=Cupriavidus metallidurans (strain ATCC 43123 / DSM 2839 / NBRC 102507 / CH34) TaxID=266264 RepID=Q1LCZ6_CUPMC|nr:TOBE domain-containing protein [Cupriavidus metallidurans]ABF11980.1 molybdenum-pterin binding domain (dual function transport/regulation) [Cupriavidus metallidurans CH34]AVA34253.1 transporter [Cupriavidus metallidurans]KWW34887.1 Molybdenum-pterin-binding protein MopA [Cupriavidus metallidurans]MDE4922095.1 TOBE domain-containing protein [Cupriavidus metallidurans]QGS32747.1 transporter [Cupriavidus metallidurans]